MRGNAVGQAGEVNFPAGVNVAGKSGKRRVDDGGGRVVSDAGAANPPGVI